MKRSTRDPRYLAVLAMAAGVILVLGNWLRPDAGAEERTAQALARDSALLQLPRLAQRRSIEDRTEFISQLVANLSPYVYRLEAANESAVLWNAATLVTALSAQRMPSQDVAFSSSAGRLETSVHVAGPHLPLALLEARVERPPQPIQRIPAASFPESSWILALWRGPDGLPEWIEGQYLRIGRENCGDLMPARTLSSTLTLTPEMAGAGIFGLDGALVGVVGACDDHLAILGMQAIELLFGRSGELEGRLLYRYGVRVDEPDEREREFLQAPQGLIVREVWIGYQGHASGLRPGDVIVGIDGTELKGIADLERLVLPVAQEIFALQVVSQGRKRIVSLRARPEVTPAFLPGGVALLRAEPGVVIEQVAAEGPFAALEVRSGDRLLSLDGREFNNPEAVERYLDRGVKTAWVTFKRGDRLWGALIVNE